MDNLDVLDNVIMIVLVLLLILILSIVIIPKHRDISTHQVLVASDSVKFAMKYHGIIIATPNEKGELYFYRDGEWCKVWNSHVEKAWERKNKGE